MLLFLIFVLGILASDKTKFEKCDQRGFCNRFRRKLDATSFKFAKVLRDDKVLYGLLSDVDRERKIYFQVDSFPQGVMRLKMSDSELNINKNQRFRMDHDDEFLKMKPIEMKQISVKDSRVSLTGSEKTSATIEKNSNFAVDLTFENVRLLGFNHRNSLDIEDDNYKRKDENDTTTYSSGDYTGLSFDIDFLGASHVYGIPERAVDSSLEHTDNDGEPYRLYNLDVFEYEIRERMGLYGSIPFLLTVTKSGKSVGIFNLNPTETFVDISKKDNNVLAHFMVSNGLVNLFFIPGPTPKDVVRKFVELTGKPFLPPKFSVGYHQCRWNYKDEDDVEEVNKKFDEHDIPMDVMWLDIEHTDSKKYFTWDRDLFPTPKKMQENLKNHGRKLVTISDPHIKIENGYFVYDEAKKNDFFIKKSDGSGSYEGKCWPGESSWLDFYNPSVRDYYSELFRYGTYEGSTDILYTWIDMNEPSVFSGPEVTLEGNVLHQNGVQHREIHNVYGYYHALATYKGHLLRGYGKRRPFILTRSFFIGSQQYAAVWTGDNEASWDHIKYAIPMLTSLGISGIPFVGADVGGFFGNPDEELLTRFYQAGLFFPFFRAHAHYETKRREPWLFGDEVTQRIREAVALRYRLLPFYYTLFYETHTTGIPILRPLFLEFPEDEKAHDYQEGFMIGDSLYSRPVAESGVESVDVYFAKGKKWFNFFSGAIVSNHGGEKIKQEVNMDSIPLYQVGGSIVSTQERLRRNSKDMELDPFSLFIALDEKYSAKGELYMDDGDSFEYKKEKKYTILKFLFKKKELIVSSDHSGYETTNTLEKVVVYGLPRKPSSVNLYVNNEEKKLDFKWKDAVLTIRNPNVKIAQEFKIKLD